MGTNAVGLVELESDLRDNYLAWYKNSQRKWLCWYMGLQILAILASFLTAVIAAFMNGNDASTGMKAWIVILPLISGLAGAVLTQGNFMAMIRLRDAGRIDILQLMFEVQKYLSMDITEQYSRIVAADIRNKLIDIERRQSAQATGFWKEDFVANVKNGS